MILLNILTEELKCYRKKKVEIESNFGKGLLTESEYILAKADLIREYSMKYFNIIDATPETR